MPKKRSTRKGKPLVAIRVQNQVALTTLADSTVISVTLATLTAKFYAISAKLMWSIRGKTANEGPLMLGLSHGDLSVTEIKEALEADLAIPDDIIARERTRRPIRDVGYFMGNDQAQEHLNNGLQVKTPLRFALSDNKTIVGFIYNQSGGALTTGSIVEVTGTIFGKWT